MICFILAAWRGGQSPLGESPISSIPAVLIDYANNETEIFVHGLGDFRYTNLTIRISNEKEKDNESRVQERSKESSLFIFHSTRWDNFTLNISVVNKNKQYAFNCTLQIAPPEQPSAVMTIYQDKAGRVTTYVLSPTGLPWKKMLERIK